MMILEKYRQVPWLFSIYENIDLKEIYVLAPKHLEPVFKRWEDHLNGNKIYRGEKVKKVDSINNPKIPIKFVRENGIKVFPYNKTPIDPAKVVDSFM